MAILKVGSSAAALADVTPDPASISWGLQDVSASDAGRTQDGSMQKMLVTQKRKLTLSWSLLTPAQASAILQAFNAEYFYVRYLDWLSGAYEVRQFYAGDRSAPVQWINVPGRADRAASVSFDIIER